MQLDEERQFYESRKDDLVKTHLGQFVLIKGKALVGLYPDVQMAYLAGLEKFGLEPFLVRQVLEEEPVAFVPMMSVVPHAR